MSSRAVASQRCRWLDFCQWSTFAQRSSTSALTDSRQFVISSDRPSTPYSPRRCSVKVSSSPSARLLAADWVRSSSSRWSALSAPRSLGVHGAGVGALEALAPYSLLTLGQVTHHVLALVPLAAVDQGPIPEGFPDG